eukprot:scaffold45530_cov68-Phaeocystis_antarctica.AAC.2
MLSPYIHSFWTKRAGAKLVGASVRLRVAPWTERAAEDSAPPLVRPACPWAEARAGCGSGQGLASSEIGAGHEI